MERADLRDRLERLRAELDDLIDELAEDEPAQPNPVIDEFSRQIIEHATPKIEELIRAAIQSDEPLDLDKAMLSEAMFRPVSR